MNTGRHPVCLVAISRCSSEFWSLTHFVFTNVRADSLSTEISRQADRAADPVQKRMNHIAASRTELLCFGEWSHSQLALLLVNPIIWLIIYDLFPYISPQPIGSRGRRKQTKALMCCEGKPLSIKSGGGGVWSLLLRVKLIWDPIHNNRDDGLRMCPFIFLCQTKSFMATWIVVSDLQKIRILIHIRMHWIEMRGFTSIIDVRRM